MGCLLVAGSVAQVWQHFPAALWRILRGAVWGGGGFTPGTCCQVPVWKGLCERDSEDWGVRVWPVLGSFCPKMLPTPPSHLSCF